MGVSGCGAGPGGVMPSPEAEHRRAVGPGAGVGTGSVGTGSVGPAAGVNPGVGVKLEAGENPG